jgi:hypothetical protein
MVAVTDAGYTKPRTHTEAVPGTGVKKLTPHTTKKKLPWLGGKPSGFMSPMPAQRPGSDIQSPSPSTRPSSRKPSAVVAPRSVPIKSARKKSLVVPTRPRFPSLAGSSPSPVARHRLSQARRVSIAPKDPSPLRAQAAHRPFALHEPQKRLSIVQHHNEELEEANFGKVRPRTDSLAPVPDHLEISDTSDSTFGREVASSSSLAVISRVQMAPLQPTPSRTAIEPIYDRKLSTAIEGLEDMVQEAVDIADETADRHGVEEIYEIIEDARAAIQDASKHPMANLMATTSPLAISGSSGEVQDVGTGVHKVYDDPQRGSNSFDWAYSPQTRQPQLRFSSSSSDNEEHGRSNLDTQSDLLLPPQPIQPVSRDHVDFVLRPVTRDHSRGRSRQRLNSDSAVRIARRRRQNDPERDSRSRSRRRQQMSSGFSQNDASADEEHLPAKAYGNELSVREQAHHHTFNLRRHHHRQPIARNWSTGKKRLTATIACINTALLGIIVGIYVSKQSEQSAVTDIAQAGEVPCLQYYLADESHHVVVGNAVCVQTAHTAFEY